MYLIICHHMDIHINSIFIHRNLHIWVHRTRGTFRALVRDSINCIKNHIKDTRTIRTAQYLATLILPSIRKSSDLIWNYWDAVAMSINWSTILVVMVVVKFIAWEFIDLKWFSLNVLFLCDKWIEEKMDLEYELGEEIRLFSYIKLHAWSVRSFVLYNFSFVNVQNLYYLYHFPHYVLFVAIDNTLSLHILCITSSSVQRVTITIISRRQNIFLPNKQINSLSWNVIGSFLQDTLKVQLFQKIPFEKKTTHRTILVLKLS